MAYTPTYTSSDLSSIFVETVAIIGVTLNENMNLIILLIVISLVIALVGGIFTGLFSGLIGKLTKRF